MNVADFKSVLMRALELAPTMSPDDVEYICKQIIAGQGGHGDFLKAFAMAFIRADADNRELLMPSALPLVVKYDLAKYLPDAGGRRPRATSK